MHTLAKAQADSPYQKRLWEQLLASVETIISALPGKQHNHVNDARYTQRPVRVSYLVDEDTVGVLCRGLHQQRGIVRLWQQQCQHDVAHANWTNQAYLPRGFVSAQIPAPSKQHANNQLQTAMH